MSKRVAPKVTLDTPIGPDVDLEKEVVRDKRGRRVTDAYVESLVEAGRKPGRPSLAKGRSPAVAFRLPRELRQKAEAVAKREGKTISQLAREALESRLQAS
jgi:predicted HicB family RNase H-like nuclease